MARPKKQYPERDQALQAAKAYVERNIPELGAAPLQLHALDAPPGAPRYAVTAELCQATRCPHGVKREVAAAGRCPVLTCKLRDSVRLLLDEQNEVVHETRGGVHWG